MSEVIISRVDPLVRRMRRCAKLALLAAAILALAAAGPALAAQPSDAWITTKVKMQLLTASGVNALDVNVDTVEGRVTLHGDVASEEAKTRAAELARQVEGVRDVQNLLAVAPATEAEQARAEVDDEALKRQIETVLERDEGLRGSDVEVVSVNEGKVVLGGEAQSLSAHRRALEDVRAVKGVTQVASEIQSPDELGDREVWQEVEQSGERGFGDVASDTWTTTKVKVALMADQGVSPFDVNVDTRNGVVTLFGIVPSDEVKQKSAARAREVSGVQAVENELQVVRDVAADRVQEEDDAIQEAVSERIAQRGLAGADVEVEVHDGVARLTGEVASQSDRLTVLTVARATDGVRAVIDDLDTRVSKQAAAETSR